MRKFVCFLLAGVFLSTLCANFVACNESGESGKREKGTEIQLAPISAEIIADFGDNLLYSLARTVCYDHELHYFKMFNSAEELPKVDLNGLPFNLPNIDFDSYTLVIGECFAVQGGYQIEHKGAVVGSKKMTIYVSLVIPEGIGGVASPMSVPFGALYPKLPTLPIDVVVE